MCPCPGFQVTHHTWPNMGKTTRPVNEARKRCLPTLITMFMDLAMDLIIVFQKVYGEEEVKNSFDRDCCQ